MQLIIRIASLPQNTSLHALLSLLDYDTILFYSRYMYYAAVALFYTCTIGISRRTPCISTHMLTGHQAYNYT